MALFFQRSAAMRRVIHVALLGVLVIPAEQATAQTDTSALRSGARVRLWRHGPTSGFFQGTIVERIGDTLTVSDRRTDETHIRIAIPDLDSAYVRVWKPGRGFNSGFWRGALVGLGVALASVATIARRSRADANDFGVPVEFIAGLWGATGMVTGGIIGGALGARPRTSWVPVALPH